MAKESKSPAFTEDQIEQVLANPQAVERCLLAATKGDESALPVVARVLDSFPAGTMFPMAEETERALLKHFYRENLLRTEEVKREAAALRKQLAGDNPAPLEKLLVERVVISWLALNGFEWLYAECAGRLPAGGGAIVEAWERRIDRLSRRFLAAAKALAQVRRLAIPVALQINVHGAQGPAVASAATLNALLPAAPALPAAAANGSNGNGRH